MDNDILYGWRFYQLTSRNGKLLLRGGYSKVWLKNQMRAECVHLKIYYLDYLDPTCSCGIYGFLTENEFKFYNNHYTSFPNYQVSFVARCVFWGKVQIHERGYRAEYCRIEELFLVDKNFQYLHKENWWGKNAYNLQPNSKLTTKEELIEEIKERYKVPVSLVPLSYFDIILKNGETITFTTTGNIT